MIRVYEALLTHAGAGDSTGGVDTNHDVTVDSRWAVEIAWQN